MEKYHVAPLKLALKSIFVTLLIIAVGVSACGKDTNSDTATLLSQAWDLQSKVSAD